MEKIIIVILLIIFIVNSLLAIFGYYGIEKDWKAILFGDGRE